MCLVVISHPIFFGQPANHAKYYVLCTRGKKNMFKTTNQCWLPTNNKQYFAWLCISSTNVSTKVILRHFSHPFQKYQNPCSKRYGLTFGWSFFWLVVRRHAKSIKQSSRVQARIGPKQPNNDTDPKHVKSRQASLISCRCSSRGASFTSRVWTLDQKRWIERTCRMTRVVQIASTMRETWTLPNSQLAI